MSEDKIILINKIEILQNQSIYDFVSQFQSLTDKIICIINNIKIHLYSDDDDDFPKKVTLCYKDKTNNSITIYHFNDLITNDRYCLFGKKITHRFLSNIEKRYIDKNNFNYIKSSIINNPIKNNCLVKIIDHDETTIIDGNDKITFVNYNHPLQIINIID